MKTSELYVKKTNKKYIYNICPFENVKQVLQNGLLSYNKSQNIQHTSIASNSVQEKRNNKFFKNGKNIHEYANCYLNPRNSMLYCRQSECESLAILCISVDVLDLPDVIVSDMNAAKKIAKLMDIKDALETNSLNFEKIFAKNWNSNDPMEKEIQRAYVQAEILVPDKIDPKYICEIKVVNENAKKNLQNILKNCNILINVDKYLFFNLR